MAAFADPIRPSLARSQASAHDERGLPPFLQSDVDCSLNNLPRSVARSLSRGAIGPTHRLDRPPDQKEGDLHCIGDATRRARG